MSLTGGGEPIRGALNFDSSQMRMESLLYQKKTFH
jgi:hypothetical protein